MVSIKTASLFLGLLFVFHALRNFSAHAHQGSRPVTFNRKELLESIPTRKVSLGGRKMVVEREIKKEGAEGLNADTSKISGEDKNVSKKSLGRPQSHLNNQDNSNTLETNTLKFARSESSRSTKQVTKEPHGKNIGHKDESQRLVEVAHEIVNLMRKDYQGMDDMPRRKPPVNNHEPND